MKSIVTSLPFCICLCWLVTFVLNYRNSDPAKRLLTWFIATCAVLYGCHAVYFNEEETLLSRALYTFCTLSVYPLYYMYIYVLTTGKSPRWRQFAVLLTGVLGMVLVATDVSFAPLYIKVVALVQIVIVLVFGLRRLSAYNRQIDNFYSETEGYSLRSVSHLLVLLAVTSMSSAAANLIGREFFLQNPNYLTVPFVMFSSMLFGLFYEGHRLGFPVRTFIADAEVETPVNEVDDTVTGLNEVLNERLRRVMTEQQMFRRQNLKVTDVAQAIGSCRTYVSKMINQEYGMSFTDYINMLRVEYAKEQLRGGAADETFEAIALDAGFSNRVSFYRNFKKVTGVSPSEWNGD
ncbi:MAG: helix-turn-helix domain-containing protein [Bacteroidaceae bacterium]|nr:helix-turn-helix domain-containing protein [Bacteroidaceae bacterium]